MTPLTSGSKNPLDREGLSDWARVRVTVRNWGRVRVKGPG